MKLFFRLGIQRVSAADIRNRALVLFDFGIRFKIVENSINNNPLFNDMIWYVKELKDLTKLTNFEDLNELSFNDLEVCQRLLHYALETLLEQLLKVGLLMICNIL